MTLFIGIVLLVIPIAYYMVYGLTARILSKKMSTDNATYRSSFAPFVSVVIPTYNESKMIGKRIENFDIIEYQPDDFELIFVDGASTDGTPEIIEHLKAEGRPSIRLVRQASRKGYNAAVYEGVSQAKADIVVVGEVGGMWHPNALSAAVRHFTRPSVGVVTGRSVLYNPDESLATRLESAYRDAHDVLRFCESQIDSTPDMKGELLAFRKEIGLSLRPGETLPDSASFDMSISYKARELGMKAILEPEAVFYEYAPKTMKERMIVQIRRATTFTGALWRFRSMILNPKFGYFGMLITPSRLLMLIAFPWMLLIAPFAILVETLAEPLIGLILLGLALMCAVHRRLRYTLVAFALSQFVLAIATLRLSFRKHTQIIDTVPTARR